MAIVLPLLPCTFFIVTLLFSPSLAQLSLDFYDNSCPNLPDIVHDVMSATVSQNPRMGCDGSVLLDDTDIFIGEKSTPPNKNSTRGFEVIDNIKSEVEIYCSGIVSCADILALAVRDAVELGVFGSALQVSLTTWCVHKKGPLFVAMFHLLGIVIAAAFNIIVSKDAFYLGSLLGSIIIVVGFYSVMWGKSKEGKVVEDHFRGSSVSKAENSPLLENQEP